MKKLLFSLFISIITTTAFAQIPSIGIKGGLNLAKVTSNDGGGNYSTGTLSTFNVGAFVDLKFGNLSLQPGLNYFGEGGTENLVDASAYYPGEPASNSGKAEVHLNYLQLPVNLLVHVPAIIANFYFGGGPYIAEGISGKTTYTNGNPSQKVNFGSGDFDVRPTQFGADALVGFKFKPGLLIDATYTWGLSNDNPTPNTGSSKARVFSLSVGYQFL